MIERLVISGGEPSLMKDMYSWTQRAKLINKEILFNTNCAVNETWWTKFLQEIELLSKQNRVIIRVSMDAQGSRFEWIRTGIKWNVFERCFSQLVDLARKNHILIRVSPTLSCLALEGLRETIEYVRSVGHGKEDVIELDAMSIVSWPTPQRPDPWLKEFTDDLMMIEECQNYMRVNRDLLAQSASLLKVGLARNPTKKDAEMMVSALDDLEIKWSKPSWRHEFPRLFGISNQCLDQSS